MVKKKLVGKYTELERALRSDCEKCSGLCCVALFCTKTDGFPENKAAGVPCKYLQSDFRCEIHNVLAKKKMKGCLAYDCFGAGQKVTQTVFLNENWKNNPPKAKAMFQVYRMVFQLHQMEWYLLEAMSLITDEPIEAEIEKLIAENESTTSATGDEILNFDIDRYRIKVNLLLKQISNEIKGKQPDLKGDKDYFGKNVKGKNFDKSDLSMALMIAANLEGCSFKGTNFLGADLRDANIINTDLSESLFLTQMQINAARGNKETKLPEKLLRPCDW